MSAKSKTKSRSTPMASATPLLSQTDVDPQAPPSPFEGVRPFIQQRLRISLADGRVAIGRCAYIDGRVVVLRPAFEFRPVEMYPGLASELPGSVCVSKTSSTGEPLTKLSRPVVAPTCRYIPAFALPFATITAVEVCTGTSAPSPPSAVRVVPDLPPLDGFDVSLWKCFLAADPSNPETAGVEALLPADS
eukprot:TRINITY_DN62020_c0_g1_i1.p1 TRINITY_DN62020_c0_g1~~TRINITY_DN62020_c0_g1_i1.p1  ORF type:complete len:205 (+),score=2.71 TRINITY_DN62020_c0_g1_i1:47-616(+)